MPTRNERRSRRESTRNEESVGPVKVKVNPGRQLEKFDELCSSLSSKDSFSSKEISSFAGNSIVDIFSSDRPVRLPSSFFDLVSACSSTQNSKIWPQVRRITSGIFTSTSSPVLDEESVIILLSSFLRQFLLTSDEEDLRVIELISSYLDPASTDGYLLATVPLFSYTLDHLLVPASIFLRKCPKESETCSRLKSLLVFALFSEDLISENGVLENPFLSAISSGEFSDKMRKIVRKLRVEESLALLECVLDVSSRADAKFPREKFLVEVAGWCDIYPLESETELKVRTKTFLGPLLKGLKCTKLLLDAEITEDGKSLMDWTRGLLLLLLKQDPEGKETSLELESVAELLETFPSLGLDSASDIFSRLLETHPKKCEPVLLCVLSAYSGARLLPKFVSKLLTALEETSWTSSKNLTHLLKKFGEEISLLPQSQVASTIKTLQFHLNRDIDEEATEFVASLLQLALKNSRLPSVGVSAWVDSVSSTLLECLPRAEGQEKLLTAFQEWTAFISQYSDALDAEMDSKAPNFPVLRKEVGKRLKKTANKDSKKEINGDSVSEKVRSICRRGFQLASETASELKLKIVAKKAVKLSSLCQDDEFDIGCAVDLWAPMCDQLMTYEAADPFRKQETSDLVGATSTLPTESLNPDDKFLLFALHSTFVGLELHESDEIFAAIARLFDLSTGKDAFLAKTATGNSLSLLARKMAASGRVYRPLAEKMVNSAYIADKSREKNHFLEFVTSCDLREVHLTVLNPGNCGKKGGQWKKVSRTFLSEAMGKMDAASDTYMEILLALVVDGDTDTVSHVAKLKKSLLTEGFLDNLSVTSSNLSLKILAEDGKIDGDTLWRMLKLSRDWRRHLAGDSTNWLTPFAESSKGGSSSGFETCFKSCCDKMRADGKIINLTSDIVERLNEELTEQRFEAAGGTLWIASDIYRELTKAEMYWERDSMAMKVGHAVKAIALNCGQSDPERRLLGAYLHLHAQFLEKTRLKWIFFLGGYQVMLCRALDVQSKFDEVGAFCLTAACEVMYQALKKPGFVVSGWEHVLGRHLVWAWKLLCRWVSDCNDEESLSPEARLRLVTCAKSLDRIPEHVKKNFPADFARLAPYVIVDCVTSGLSAPILPDLKKYLDAFLFKLLDVCDEISLKYLKSCFQSGPLAEVHDKLIEDYRRHGKFVGRV